MQAPIFPDRIEFGPGIHPQDLQLRRKGTALVIENTATGDGLWIEDWETRPIETLVTDTGAVLVNRRVREIIAFPFGASRRPSGKA